MAAEQKAFEIIAQALVDAGANVVTHVPGYGANQVFARLQELDPDDHCISFNEEVAYTIAHGAAMTGSRSATLIKAHGFAKAGNSVIDSLFTGTTAGFVNLVFDDREGRHSDSIFDIESFLRGTRIPYQIVSPDTVYTQVLAAFTESESRALPTVLLVDSMQVDQIASYHPAAASPPAHTFVPDLHRYYLQPVFAQYQQRVLAAKLQGKDWSQLQRPPIPHIPADLPETWTRLMTPYTPFFEVFKTLRGEIVTGDTGISHLFAFPPYQCCDLSTYMGGSIPLAIGAYLAGHQDVWALIGDFSFIAAGQLALSEAIQRRIPLKTVIFWNGKAAATGGQEIPAETWHPLIKGYAPFVAFIHDPWNPGEIRQVLEEAKAAQELRIIVADYRNQPKRREQRAQDDHEYTRQSILNLNRNNQRGG